MTLSDADRAYYWAAGAELARRSRAAQGLPPTITDPLAIARAAELLLQPQHVNPSQLDADAARCRRVDPGGRS